MAYRTLQRIPDWDTDRTLFEAAVATCPNSTKMNLQIGQVRGVTYCCFAVSHHLCP